MAQNITLMGASYSAVPAVTLPKTGGGTARFDDASVTTATAADVASGKLFLAADGTVTTGTSSGGGSSKNVQVAQSTTRATSSTYTELVSLTCATSGTYDVYWSGFRSSTSGTWGSQLYVNDTARGSAQSSFTNHIQNVHLTGISLSAGDDVAVRARSRGSNYYAYIGTLTIVQTS